MKHFLLVVERVMKMGAMTLTGAMLVWVFLQVLTRYFFSYTPSFGEELARYMFVWIVFLTMPLVGKAGGHMAIETIAMHLKGKALRNISIIAESLTICFLLIMVWQGTQMVIRVAYQTSPALEISMSWVYSVIPFSCFVMLINTLDNFFTLIRTPVEEKE